MTCYLVLRHHRPGIMITCLIEILDNSASRYKCHIPIRVLRKNSSSLSTASDMVVPRSVSRDDSPPPRKKLRQEASTKSSTNKEPRLFVPFRALGLVTNHIPIVLQTRSHKGATDGPKIHFLTCLGKSWALWEGEKMTLLFVGMCVT